MIVISTAYDGNGYASNVPSGFREMATGEEIPEDHIPALPLSKITGVMRGMTTIAADQSEKIITDVQATAGAIVRAWLQTNDATAKSAVAVPENGSFTIFLDAQATGQVSVGYEIFY